jgi:hypothetical protein
MLYLYIYYYDGVHLHGVQVMESVLTSADVKSAVLVSSKPGCFIAGADIGWLDSANDREEVRCVTPKRYQSFCPCSTCGPRVGARNELNPSCSCFNYFISCC